MKLFLGRLLAALLIAAAPGLAGAQVLDLRPLVNNVANGGTPSQSIPNGKTLLLPAPTTANASLNLPQGTAPTSPANGDVWTTSAGIFVRIAGSTVGPLGSGGGSPGGSSGQVQYNNSGAFGGFTVSGDGTLNTATGALAVTKTGGVSFAASATTDTTNAANIGSGVLGSSRGGAGSVSGLLKANGSGVVSAAVSGTDYSPAGAISALTGDVTASGPGSSAATLAASGVSAGTYGSATQVPRVTFDAKGRATGVTLISIAGGSGGSGGGLFTPQGRLTLTSATPVMTADMVAATSVYYTPYQGSQVPIYDGSSWANYTFPELTLALDSTNHVLNSVYDVFVWNNSGTIAIGAGPAWSNTSTVTISIASPAVISWTGHGLSEGSPVVFTTTGALPTGITAGTTYYVSRLPGANSFNIATNAANASAGSNVNTSGTQSGTQTATHRSSKRGAGAGTTELQLLNGIWANKNSITLTNGAGAGTSGIAAGTATYVGSFAATGNGQTTMAFKPAAVNGGSTTNLAVFNAYNRVPMTGMSRDSTASWTYTLTTWRAANGSMGNRVSFLDGLGQSFVTGEYFASFSSATSGAGYTGINLDTTADAPAVTSQQQNSSGTANLQAITVTDSWRPGLGYHYVSAMEASTNTSTWYGAQTSPARQLNALRMTIDN